MTFDNGFKVGCLHCLMTRRGGMSCMSHSVFGGFFGTMLALWRGYTTYTMRFKWVVLTYCSFVRDGLICYKLSKGNWYLDAL